MPAPENRFKARLAAGETLIGAWVGLALPIPTWPRSARQPVSIGC